MYGLRGFGDVLSAPPVASVSLAPPDFALLNLTQAADMTRGGVFQVGDRWRAVIGNVAKSQPVLVHAVHDGVDLGASVVGNSGEGVFSLDGSMDPTTAGHWDETWSVPGGYYSDYLPSIGPLDARLSFDVKGAAESPARPPQGAPALTPTLTVPPSTSHQCFSFIGWKNDIGSCIGPLTVTSWLIAGAVAFFALRGAR